MHFGIISEANLLLAQTRSKCSEVAIFMALVGNSAREQTYPQAGLVDGLWVEAVSEPAGSGPDAPEPPAALAVEVLDGQKHRADDELS